MLLFPRLYYKNVQSINLSELKSNNVKGIILDVDNTLIDYAHNLSDEVTNWVLRAKAEGFKMVILSNSNNKPKVSKVAKILDLDYDTFGMKPLKRGFIKAQRKLNIPNENIAVVGDQIFTDVLGANRMKMISVYVEPIDSKDYWYTKWKRPIEDYILSKRPTKSEKK